MPDEPTIDSRRVRRAFDRAAASYDTQAVVQREVATRLLERLQLVKLAPRLALDLGSGTGFVARGLRERYSEARVVAVDSSFAMLAASGRGGSLWRRLRAKGNYARVVGAMEQLPVASECADLICSNLALEWSAAPRRVFAEVHRCLRADGLFMFTTVGPATLRELKRACPDVSLQPTADMHDIGDALVRAGFASPVLDMELINVTYARACAGAAGCRRSRATTSKCVQAAGFRPPWRSSTVIVGRRRCSASREPLRPRR
jgi:malonyl-CoA O-methyltransferase